MTSSSFSWRHNLKIILKNLTKNCFNKRKIRGGVFKDVLGLEDTFWSPWPWPRRSSPWPWPQVLESARGQHFFLNCWNLVDCLKKYFRRRFLLENTRKIFWRPFFLRTLALVSLVLGLGLEHSCPWPREDLPSEGLSLASDFFLCPWPWPRALCPRLHLCKIILLLSLTKQF